MKPQIPLWPHCPEPRHPCRWFRFVLACLAMAAVTALVAYTLDGWLFY